LEEKRGKRILPRCVYAQPHPVAQKKLSLLGDAAINRLACRLLPDMVVRIPNTEFFVSFITQEEEQ
jgi:hypothetical protein